MSNEPQIREIPIDILLFIRTHSLLKLYILELILFTGPLLQILHLPVVPDCSPLCHCRPPLLMHHQLANLFFFKTLYALIYSRSSFK